MLLLGTGRIFLAGGNFIAAAERKILESKSSALTPISWKSGKLRETHSLSAYFFQLLIFFLLAVVANSRKRNHPPTGQRCYGY